MIEEIDEVLEDRDVIFRGFVRETDGWDVSIEVAETFKGAGVIGDSFTFRPVTSRDRNFSIEDAEYLFFGSLFRGEVSFFIGNGAVRSDDPVFEPLLEELRDRRADQ